MLECFFSFMFVLCEEMQGLFSSKINVSMRRQNVQDRTKSLYHVASLPMHHRKGNVQLSSPNSSVYYMNIVTPLIPYYHWKRIVDFYYSSLRSPYLEGVLNSYKYYSHSKDVDYPCIETVIEMANKTINFDTLINTNVGSKTVTTA